MSNLESSWEETVVKLARAGNLRAVAFWLNRDLVAQGICVQATTNQPGHLTLQILCRQAPDRDRLVHFIGERLSQLYSPVIQSVHFKVQLVGSAEILWTQTAHLAPVSPFPNVAEPIGTETRLTAQAADRGTVPQAGHRSTVLQAGHQDVNSVQPVPIAVAASTASNVALQDSVAPVSEQMPAVAAASVAASGSVPATIAFQPTVPKTQPGTKPETKPGASSRPKSLKRKTAHWLKHSQQQMQQSGRQLRQTTEQSIQWFQRQKPRQKAVILGGSAIAAFLLGCGFELLRYQVTLFTAKSQNPEAAAGARYEGMVKTALEQVPVVQLPAANASDPAITLLFSNAVTLTSASGQSGIAAQQNVDMLISSLNAPLAGLAGTAAQTEHSANSSTNPSVAPSVSPLTSPSETTPEAATQPAIEFDQSASADSAGAFGPFPQAMTDGSDLSESDLSESDLSESSSEADLSESSIDSAETDSVAEPPPINLPPLTLQQLQANRVNVVNLASNPLIQSGGDALNETIKSLSQASIYPIGAGANQQSARRPQIFSIKGKRIAYLGYSDVSLQTAAQNAAGLNTSVNEQVEADIKSIRNQVDWVVVSYHWNQNLRSYPEDWQINITHAAIDHGADLVVGYHPTVTQGAEVYGGRAIVYSLGSLLDPYQAQDAEPTNQQYETLALKLSLQEQQMQLELLPVRVSGGQTEVLTAEAGTSILDYLKQASSLFRQPLRSPTTLDARIRLTLPAAPNSDKPFSEPFTVDPTQP
ncbi:CapA family protein [Leptolyngbya sp. FACHB-711]|uniref:CapA family protein n=1 Tax=Leptolyngbya sp. FACHB-711 TaxID=2692813 RepID=UPI0016869AA0|nr:CapA family protein [Leptolyngbya sp. FACHB-711]MBD1849544.1 CapA family protein [Cyanobacteria bacterium FACHB-502]MBD2024901.1 CapA family protein [Leptolyngbya sp. FACHB-711]